MTLWAISNHLNSFFLILYSLPGSWSVNGLHNVPFVVNGKVIVWCLISNITFSLVVFVSEKQLIFTNILEAPLSQTPQIYFKYPVQLNSSKNEACILKINAILSQVSFWKQCLIWWSYAGFLFFCVTSEPQCVLMLFLAGLTFDPWPDLEQRNTLTFHFWWQYDLNALI